MNFERKNKILAMLRSNGVVMLKDLCRIFPNVSEMTIRRDLEYFEKTGEAVRIKGGARCSSFKEERLEEVFTKRLIQNSAAKEKIARLALEFVESGRSIFVDAGSTMLAFAKLLPEKELSLVTNGTHIAIEAAKNPDVNITLIGGDFNRSNQSVSGAQSIEFVKNIKFDIAFISASAISAQGLTQGNLSECDLKKHIIKQANQRIILVDSGKFGKTMPFCFATFSDVDVIITDKRPSDDMLFHANIYGIKVIWE